MSTQTGQAPRGNRVAPKEPKHKENRDPNNINSHVECQFYSVFAEPSGGPRSFDCIWEFSELLYDCCKDCWYKLFSLCFGCCIAIAWGIEFVPVLFSNIWIFTPFRQCLNVVIGNWCRSCCFLLSQCFIAPWCNATAHIFRHCGYGVYKRPETPSLFPPRQKKPKPKPVDKKSEPVVEEKKAAAPAAGSAKGEFDNYDKEKMANSIRRQMLLV